MAGAVSLTVVKSSSVLSDPFNGMTNAKRIPGAVVEYSMVVANDSGNVAADNVVVTDAVPADVTYVPGSIRVNGVAEDDDAAGADETNPDGGDFGVTAPATVTGRIASIPAGGSATLVFRVTVN